MTANVYLYREITVVNYCILSVCLVTVKICLGNPVAVGMLCRNTLDGNLPQHAAIRRLKSRHHTEPPAG